MFITWKVKPLQGVDSYQPLAEGQCVRGDAGSERSYWDLTDARNPGIATIVDRVIQQAVSRQLAPIYERQFSPSSYGIRPKRDDVQALQQRQEDANKGYRYFIFLLLYFY